MQALVLFYFKQQQKNITREQRKTKASSTLALVTFHCELSSVMHRFLSDNVNVV